MSRHCVIVGAGHAAAQLCQSLVQGGWTGTLTLIGEEPLPPYHRPPLSKTQLDPACDVEPALIRPHAFYGEHGIALRLGERVESIDRDRKRVETDKGGLDYDVLILCTGSRVRIPPIEGISLPGVMVLRSAADAEALRRAGAGAGRVVLIGAGFIGLEAAAAFRSHGREVTVLEREDRVLARVTCPAVSRFVEGLHRQRGVRIDCGVAVERLSKSEAGLAVHLAGGRVLEAETVVVGAGALAETRLAEAAGLEVDNGIRVNEMNQSSDPAIYAMGDCCSQWFAPLERWMRIESVQNANDQAKTVAAALLGNPQPHQALPWFWSDQFDLKLQMTGISTREDEVVLRGSGEPGSPLSAWYYRQGMLRAADALNDPRAYAAATKCLKAGLSPSPAVVADTSIDYKTLIQSTQET